MKMLTIKKWFCFYIHISNFSLKKLINSRIKILNMKTFSIKKIDEKQSAVVAVEEM